MTSTLCALGAIALWSTLASFGVALSHLPPFLLTGLALAIGSVPSWAVAWRRRDAWRVPAPTLLLGVGGLFGYHFLFFLALRHAPPVEANLVNYLWPLLLVVLAPALLPGLRLRAAHVAAALLGFAGAALAILGGRGPSGGWAWGYLPALGSAFGRLAYLTPLASTALLALTTGRALTAWTALAAALIVGAALVAVTSR